MEYEMGSTFFVGLKRIRVNINSRWKPLVKDNSLVRNEKAGPLVEESLLLGLAVVTVSIVITVILQATGWAQNVVDGLLQLLQDSWSSLTQLFTMP
jgi:hypothetical protein